MFLGSPIQVLTHHVESTSLSARPAPDAGIPDELDDLIDGCLQNDPEVRPLSAAALKTRMEVIRSRLTQSRYPVEVIGAEQSVSPNRWGRAELEARPGGALPDWFESTANPSIEKMMTGGSEPVALLLRVLSPLIWIVGLASLAKRFPPESTVEAGNPLM